MSVNPPPWHGSDRLAGLRRFAVAITTLNLLGHTVLGFEQPWIVPFVSVVAAYATELLLETVDAAVTRRAARYRGGLPALVDFLLPAHISGLAVGMLLYPNTRLMPVVCGAVTAIGSKSMIRGRVDGASRHLMNPSNVGIVVTVLVFPWVGVTPPYQFTEDVDVVGDWLLPVVMTATGLFLNARFTHRLPVVAGWVGGFVAQAVARSLASGAPLADSLVPPLVPMTSVAFILYTLYMVTDPATTPSRRGAQAMFGAAVAATYGALVALHVVYGLFFALAAVSTVRAAYILGASLVRRTFAARERHAPAVAEV